jgi:hypothetical protein
MASLVTDEIKLSGLRPIADRRSGKDRRKEIRLASRSSAASLCVAARPPVEAQIRDVSRSGLGITTSAPVLVGSSVILVCGGLTINGTIRHCRERVSGEYCAGILITKIVDTGAGKEI